MLAPLGTPNTLAQAIENGRLEAISKCLYDERASAIIETHVRDFMAQKFCPAVYRKTALEVLWEEITGRIYGKQHHEHC